jgi:raffinose/stachyose/melibiose transport system substrate-binding protein
MKKIKKLFLLLLSLVLAVMSTACGQVSSSSSNAASKKTTISVWLTNYVTSTEAKGDQSKWLISSVFSEFEKANPGVTIKASLFSGSPDLFAKYKAAGLSKNGPDVFNMSNGSYLFPMKDIVLHLNGKIPADDLKNIMGWETVTLDFKSGGQILGYPGAGTNAVFFFYNKKLVKSAGLDFEANSPKTLSEFNVALKAIKDKGITPILDDEGAGAGLMFYMTDYWWVQQTTAAGIANDYTGKTKFADDKGLLSALDAYQSLYKNGYVNVDTATSSDSKSKFMQGGGALFGSGPWDISDIEGGMGADNVGILAVPDISANAPITNSCIGGPGDCLVISNYTKNPDIAIKLLSYMDSKPVCIKLSKNINNMPIRKDISVDELGIKDDQIFKKLYALTQKYTFWVDNSVPSDYITEIGKIAPVCFVNKMTPLALAKDIDQLVLASKQ